MDMMPNRTVENYTTKNFDYLSAILSEVIETKGSSNSLNRVKRELNLLFKEFECKEIIYTKNNERLFFGMSVYPEISNRNIKDCLSNDKRKITTDKGTSYVLEFDSKLFNPLLGFTGKHICSMVLHELGHMVFDGNTTYQFRNLVDLYSAKSNINFDREAATDEFALFRYAFFDTLKKTRSFFNRNYQELEADGFVHACGYGDYLLDSFKIISTNSLNINKDVKNKLLVLSWTLDIYKNMGVLRTDALRKLNKQKDLTASILEKRNIERTINLMKDDGMKFVDSFNESYVTEKSSFIDKMRRSGLRGLKNDLYELKIQIKTVTDEENALYLLRLINSRITTLEEYIACHEEELDKKELTEWEDTLTEYVNLRIELTNKSTIKKVKMYGLYTDYNSLPAEYLSNPNY